MKTRIAILVLLIGLFPSCSTRFSFYLRNTSDRPVVVQLGWEYDRARDTIELPMTRRRAPLKFGSSDHFEEHVQAIKNNEDLFVLELPPHSVVHLDEGTNGRTMFLQEVRIPSIGIVLTERSPSDLFAWSGRWRALWYDIVLPS